MKKGILLIVVVLLSTAGLIQAQEDKLGITLDATYVSKYIWRGIDKLDDVSAFQPSINFDIGDTGLSFNVWASYAGSGGLTRGGTSRVNLTEYDYTVAYKFDLYEGQSYATNVTANYIYYDYPDEPSKVRDAQEMGVGFAWPNLCPAGVVPSYYVGKIWESRSDSALTGEFGGWVHVFGLGYDLTVPGLAPDMTEQVVSLSFAAVYNDGFAGATVDHDWSHILLGASTSFDIGPGSFAPGLYYQISMDDSVNTEDEFWTSLSYTVSF